MLKVSTAAWHIKLFYFCEMIWKKYADTWNETNSRNTDLCTYIRTIFVLAPFAVLANLATWTWIGFVFFYKPIITFGFVKIGIAAGFITGVVLFGLAGGWLLNKIMIRLYERRVQRREEEWKREEPKPEPKHKSFMALLWEYLVNAHNKVCVIIKLEEPKQGIVQ